MLRPPAAASSRAAAAPAAHQLPMHRTPASAAPPRHHRAGRRCPRPRAYEAAADPVVTTEWLQRHLDEVAVLDVRGHVDTQLVEPGVEASTYAADYDAYLEGHIPGAVFFDWTTDAIDASAGAPVQLQRDPDLLAAALEAKGVSSDKPVVAYDSGDGMMAARLWWMLTVAGHPSARVLDGGMVSASWQQRWGRVRACTRAKWKAEQRPTELHEPCTLKVYGCFEAAMQPALLTTLQDVQQHQQQQQDPGATSVLLLDTRNKQQYDGEVRRGPRGGRIPGAASLPRAELLDPATGWFKPLEQQRRLLEAAGVVFAEGNGQQQQSATGDTGSQRVVLYCNGGVAACTAALALHRLGHRQWCVFDGSWNEYSRSDLPVE